MRYLPRATLRWLRSNAQWHRPSPRQSRSRRHQPCNRLNPSRRCHLPRPHLLRRLPSILYPRPTGKHTPVPHFLVIAHGQVAFPFRLFILLPPRLPSRNARHRLAPMTSPTNRNSRNLGLRCIGRPPCSLPLETLHQSGRILIASNLVPTSTVSLCPIPSCFIPSLGFCYIHILHSTR